MNLVNFVKNLFDSHQAASIRAQKEIVRRHNIEVLNETYNQIRELEKKRNKLEIMVHGC